MALALLQSDVGRGAVMKAVHARPPPMEMKTVIVSNNSWPKAAEVLWG
jgi:hypothetical protein